VTGLEAAKSISAGMGEERPPLAVARAARRGCLHLAKGNGREKDGRRKRKRTVERGAVTPPPVVEMTVNSSMSEYNSPTRRNTKRGAKGR